MIVANLWNKNLAVGDVILAVREVDSRWGPLRNYTVERTEEAHAIQSAKEAAEKAAWAEKKEREEAEALAWREQRDAEQAERNRIAEEKAETRREAVRRKAAEQQEGTA
jgi:hypothetical protein